MTVRRKFYLFGSLALAVVVLGGCRAEEQGRVINYEPGVYKGKPDTQLSEVQRRTLRQRTVHQGSGITGGGGPVETKSSDVRKPLGSSIDMKALGKRGLMQAGSSTRL